MNYQASGKYQFYDFLYTQGQTDIKPTETKDNEGMCTQCCLYGVLFLK